MSKRILCAQGAGAITVYRLGLIRPFQQIGNTVQMFDPNGQKSVLDLFDEYNPTTLVIGSYELNRQVLKAIAKRPDLEIVLFTPNWGDIDKDLDENVLKATDEEKRIVEGLVKSHRVQYGYTYYAENSLSFTHNKWREVGIEPSALSMACDIYDYSLGNFDPEFECDACYVSGYWQYKGIHINQYIYPLCLDDSLRVKIFGNGWVVANCVGPIGTDKMRHLFASAKVCLAVYEPLSTKWHFDMSERPMKVMGAGGFCVSQYVGTAKNDFFTNDECVFTDNPKDFIDAVKYYVANPDDRQPYINRAIKTIYSKHTYHHRALKLSQQYGWVEEIIKLENLINQIEKVPNGY